MVFLYSVTVILNPSSLRAASQWQGASLEFLENCLILFSIIPCSQKTALYAFHKCLLNWWMDGKIGRMDECMGRWMDEEMDGWGRYRDEWMGEWMDG